LSCHLKMEAVAPLWGHVTLPICYHTLYLNPGLYFGLRLREVANPHARPPKTPNPWDAPPEPRALEQNHPTETEYTLDEAYRRRFREYLSRTERAGDLVDMANILSQRERLPRVRQPNCSYVAPCSTVYRSHLLLRRERGVVKPNLHCPLLHSHKFSDHRKKNRWRYYRCPRKLSGLLSLNGLW